MNGELPDGWASATLGEVCSKPQYGWTCRASKTGQIKYIRTTDISNGGIDWAKVPYCEDAPDNVAKYRLAPDDILVSRAGSVGVSHRVSDVPLNAVFASYLIRFKPLAGISPKFVEFFLKSDAYWRSISEFSAGIAVPNVNASKLAALEVPIAPSNEQRRIVTRLEELFEKIAASRAGLDRVRRVLDRFRQGVLIAACSGQLTADWRESVGPVTTTIPTPPQSAGQTRRRGANLSGPTQLLIDEMPDIPSCWRYVRQDCLAAPGTVITYGIVLPGPEIPHGVPYVRQQDIQDGSIRTDELRHTTKAIAERHPRSSLAGGDVLLCIIRNLRVAIVPKSLNGANITQGAVRIRPDTRYIDARYLALYLESQGAQGWMRRRYFGMDMPRINVEDARAVPIALPSIQEQLEIVRRAEDLLKLADSVDRRLDHAGATVGQLTASTLTKAFSGELVPTEAELATRERREYEPAAVLLKRIARDSHPEENRTRDEDHVSPTNRTKSGSLRHVSPHSRRSVKRRIKVRRRTPH